MKVSDKNTRIRGYIFNTIVRELLSRNHPIRELNPAEQTAIFGSQTGDFRVRLDKNNPKLFILEGRGVNPYEPLTSETTFCIPLDTLEMYRGVVALTKVKLASGCDILSYFTHCALLAHQHNLIGISAASEDNLTRITIDHPHMNLHTFTMETPTSKRGTYITCKGNTVYRTEPYDILEWVFYQ